MFCRQIKRLEEKLLWLLQHHYLLTLYYIILTWIRADVERKSKNNVLINSSFPECDGYYSATLILLCSANMIQGRSPRHKHATLV